MAELGPIDIKLTASGITEVINSFKNVEDRVVAMERKLTQLGQQGARQRTGIAKQEAKAKGDAVKQEETDAEKSEKGKTDAATKGAQKRTQVAKEAALEAGRIARTQADQEIQQAERSANTRARVSRQLAGRIVSDFRSTLGTVTRIAGSIFALGGGFSVANAFSREMQFHRAAQTASIRSDVPGHPEDRISASQIMGQSRQLAQQYNLKEEDIAEATGGFITKSSRGDVALRMMPFIAQLSKAEGTDMQTLSESLGIMAKQNPKMSEDQLKQFGRVLVGQGRALHGSVELSELAPVLPKITASASMFMGDQGDNMVKLGSIFQAAFTQTGDVAEAATATNRLASDITKPKNRSKIEALLGHTIDIGGKIEDPQRLIAEILGKTKGDVFALQRSAGLDERSARALKGALGPALEKGGGTDQGIQKAVMDFFHELNTARVTQADVDKHLAERQADDAEKVDKAFKDLERQIALKLVPHLIPLIESLGKMAPEVGKLLESLGKFIDWAAAHPWEAAFIGLGAIMAKAVTTEILASGLRNILAGALGAPGKGVGGGFAGGGVGLNLGTVSAITIGAVAGITIGNMITGALDQSGKQEQEAQNQQNQEVNKLFFGIKNNDPVAIEEAKKKIEELNKLDTGKGHAQRALDTVESDILKGNYGTMVLDIFKGAGSGIAGDLGLSKHYDENAVKNVKILQDALDEVNKKKQAEDDKLATKHNEAADKMLDASDAMKLAADRLNLAPPGQGANKPGSDTFDVDHPTRGQAGPKLTK